MVITLESMMVIFLVIETQSRNTLLRETGPVSRILLVHYNEKEGEGV
jgi:hypothetical protein